MVAVAIVNVFVHIILGTVNLAIMYDKGFLALVFGRIGKNLFMIPVESACISAMYAALVRPMVQRGMVPGLR